MDTFNIRHIFPNCKNDIKNIPLFPRKERNVKDFFDLSQLSYKQVVANRVFNTKQYWSIFKVENNDTGYFGVAFLDLRMNSKEFGRSSFYPKIVFAHRGTDDLFHDVLKADISIANQEIPTQFHDACDLVDKTLIYLGSKKADLMHTGHSLGAALAQMCAYKYSHRSIGFETPGTVGILYKIDSNKKYRDQQFLSFDLEGSLISGTLPQTGKVILGKKKVYRVGPVVRHSLIDVIDNILLYHPMSNMEPFFDRAGNFVTNPKHLQ